MPSIYEAQVDDSLPLIAHRHGFARWETIWEHAENRGLREERGGPERLAAGDKVYIPDKVERWMKVRTDKRHAFELSRPQARLRVALTDRFGEPLERRPYKVTVDGVLIDESHTSGGEADAQALPGLIDCPIPADARKALIVVEVDGRTLEWEVELGFIPPTALPVGLQVVLQNLGYLGQGAVTGTVCDATRKALRTFQYHAGLPESGTTDDETLEALDAALFREAAAAPAAKP